MLLGVIGFYLLSSSAYGVTVEWENSYHLGTEAGNTRLLVVELSEISDVPVTVFFRVGNDSTATPGENKDYTMDTSPITIEPGFTTAIRPIAINEDRESESTESIVIYMGHVINATRGMTTVFHAGIIDND